MSEQNENEYKILNDIRKDDIIEVLKEDRRTLIEFILRHHPDMDRWIEKNFGRVKE